MTDFFQNISNFINSADFQQNLLIAKIVAYILILLFIVAILYFLRVSSYMRFRFWQDMVEILTFRFYAVKKIEKQWQGLVKKLELPSEAEWKLAVIEAESILDETFQRMGFSGESFGERLKQVKPEQLKNLEDVWEAHKIRNNIVHDPDYRLSLDQAKKVLEIYEKALRDLGVF
ncbi:MAG: hypothetical protein COX34_02280 [Candidatus Nealsonbacteria bacterium CG23_combo_of_CG06-09_8_20_14_all_36_12]|uniref:DUF4145 domain-containing protein n=1 Tax=Candidatus Nealsonbacteria bacterium CG23_combo_of_CG06-09_8_20_14_all_36_12 TaxID=1974718 RepID=A0A2G9YZY9_9BACT|nr:MAG: hypothetical protein COX34_02280 [Candidatus Nealsonbacteria bacterium CG23_combo_of_CG06-09_8_20_14_all_36_12]